ncbi:RyR domain-containing protein [Parablautia muri]|uniref:Ryanodine receptor Ryr domain-containing protein n=1 Tax=Parablautia muri TaxID=2320879 RepID=A0A9X5BC16_9FIRM|nr:RyR domain-containing protein [Parablautia muri]NBJ91126.1 hypothetical protein [Parablautia muri]
MKKLLQIVTKSLSILYKILPFFIGMYCYYPVFVEQDQRIYPFLDCLYASFRLYSGVTESDIPVGALLQVARFLALAATLSILVNLLNRMNDIINGIKLLGPDSTVVYGDSVYAGYVYGSLDQGLRIRGEEKFIAGASRYLLMFSGDAANLEFYSKNYESLKNKNVYIMLENISRQNIENPLITVFSIAESCARQYWKDHPVSQSERIAIIGFESLGKNILLYGLQMNLIDFQQHFEYHIFGDGAEFRREHTELDKMTPDEIIFYDDGVCEYAKMTHFDRIIICGVEGNDNIATVSKLLISAPIDCPVYVYAPNGDIITNLFGRDRVICFGAASSTASADMIFNGKSMEAARRQHEFYYKQYGGTPWEKLDSFKRYSNVSSSDYMYTIDRLLERGMPVESIARLEHIRWCRYHYIHNWKYGADTDSNKRIHNCLVPFSELSEEEKIKDIEAIKSKM